jgi:hypothetical protein
MLANQRRTEQVQARDAGQGNKEARNVMSPLGSDTWRRVSSSQADGLARIC